LDINNRITVLFRQLSTYPSRYKNKFWRPKRLFFGLKDNLVEYNRDVMHFKLAARPIFIPAALCNLNIETLRWHINRLLIISMKYHDYPLFEYHLFSMPMQFGLSKIHLNEKLNILISYLTFSTSLRDYWFYKLIYDYYEERLNERYNYIKCVWLYYDKINTNTNILERAHFEWPTDNFMVNKTIRQLAFMLNQRENKLDLLIDNVANIDSKFKLSDLAFWDAILENYYNAGLHLNRLQCNIRKLKVTSTDLILSLIYALKSQKIFFRLLGCRRFPCRKKKIFI